MEIVEWQWRVYPAAHRDRVNLMIHLLTVPLFMAGTLALPLAALGSPWLAGAGLAAMAGAMALQGRGHRREQNPPPPFRGIGDVFKRIFVEQWVTFPRFVLSGALARAWRGTAQSES